jgi:uncharacterized protein YqgC (DUF456 family)
MTQRCVEQASHLQTLLTVAVVTAILLLGYVYPALPGTLLMSVAILVASIALNRDASHSLR